MTSSSTGLTWTASTDNVAVVGYRVYQASTGVVLTAVSAPNATVLGLTPGTTTAYYVKAFDAEGNESWRSNQISVVNPL